MTVTKALEAAGGLTRFGNPKVSLERAQPAERRARQGGDRYPGGALRGISRPRVAPRRFAFRPGAKDLGSCEEKRPRLDSTPNPTAASALHPLERDVDARYYADLLWRSRLLLLAAGVGGLALGLLVAEVQTPRFRARALLEVKPPTPTSPTVTDALVGTGNPIRDRSTSTPSSTCSTRVPSASAW